MYKLKVYTGPARLSRAYLCVS